ncbi:alpha-1,2-fucosyltransferase [Pelagicoccus sp. SDUM812003]|uniref:alpha-1,2-fucosyltransferase n=1 Tax=Pelagicoccus sp. SDUM812003 TaxID=3041267 RepID=UPI00280FB3C9|nr:alpha-1,2-fucosyltransferase [Pelagicoccus sp. SDUM812003]MDQ8205630.1 alpha-1,2-fucosyltransferase [Pelagicoccus sp. SDUM812003]
MIIVRVSGGIGNQLFQYAIGRAASHHHQVPLKLDTTSYETYTLHNGFRLKQFLTQSEIAKEQEIRRLKGADNLIYRALRRAGIIKRNTYYSEKERTIFDPVALSKNPVYLDGYWQNEKYFSNIRQILLQETQPSEPLSTQAQDLFLMTQRSNTVSIHVRRGDYLNHPEIGVLSLDYYKNATDYIKSKVQSPKFYIFSNDLEWCEQNLNFIKNPIYVNNTVTEIDDITLMSQCQHNIIANSSFSWWAAWLNQRTHKIVISPKKWMAENNRGYRWALESWIEL